MVKLGVLGVVALGVFVAIVLGLTFHISAWLGQPVVFARIEGPVSYTHLRAHET